MGLGWAYRSTHLAACVLDRGPESAWWNVQVAELTFQGVLEDRFFLMTHPNITLQRIEARFDELRQAISQQPTTGF